MAMPEYDKDRYKPKHEQVSPKTKVGSIANDFHLNQMKKFKTYSDRKKSKQDRHTAKSTPIFVPINIQGPVDGYEDDNSNKTFTVTIVYIGIFLLFALLSFGWFTDSLKLPIWAAVIVELLLGIFIYVVFIAKKLYKVDDKRINEARNRGNKSLNMATVWGINPGGISKTTYIGKTHTTVSFSGKEAIILKLLKKSVLTSDPMQDWNHYESLEKVDTLLLKSGYQFSKFNIKYNIDNDYIWDELDNNLAESSVVYGKQYSDIMIEFINNLKRTTEVSSRISVVYYVIKPWMVSTEITLEEVAIQLISMVKQARCTISEVSNEEYLRLVKEYYGLNYLDVEEIVDNLAAFDFIPIDVNLVSYINDKGEIVDLKAKYNPEIGNFYKQIEQPIKGLKDPYRSPKLEFNKYSIYADKIIDQA